MKYFNTYFRVNTKGYDFNKGFDTIAKENFNKEIIKVFCEHGWTVEEEAHRMTCTKLSKGNQDLYMHPQSFSGIVELNEIDKVLDMCKNAIMTC